MHLWMLSVAATLLFVDTGWQLLPDGHLEYIIQLEPGVAEALLQGAEVTSQIPAGFPPVRRVRIRIGEARLPRQPNETALRQLPPKLDAARTEEQIAQQSVPKPESVPKTGPARPAQPQLAQQQLAQPQLEPAPPTEAKSVLAANIVIAEPANARLKVPPTFAVVAKYLSSNSRDAANPRDLETNSSSGRATLLRPTLSPENADRAPALESTLPVALAESAPDARSPADARVSTAQTATAQVAGPTRGLAFDLGIREPWQQWGLAGLFSSLALNGFLAWAVVGQRSKLRRLARDYSAARRLEMDAQ